MFDVVRNEFRGRVVLMCTLCKLLYYVYVHVFVCLPAKHHREVQQDQ